VSQFNDNNVTTNLLVNNKQVKPALDESNKDLDKFKDKAEKGSASFSDGFKKSVGSVTSFIGAITAAIGAATLFYDLGSRIGNAWREAFRSAKESADEFRLSLDYDNVEKSINDAAQKILELEGKIAGILATDAGSAKAGLLVARYKAEIEELRKIQVSFENQTKARKNAEENRQGDLDSAKRRETELQEALLELNVSYANRRANERAEIFEDQQRELIAQLDSELEEKIRKTREASDEENKKRIEDNNKRHQDELNKIEERKRTELEAIREIRDAYRQLAEEQTRGLGFNQSSGLRS